MFRSIAPFVSTRRCHPSSSPVALGLPKASRRRCPIQRDTPSGTGGGQPRGQTGNGGDPGGHGGASLYFDHNSFQPISAHFSPEPQQSTHRLALPLSRLELDDSDFLYYRQATESHN